MNKSYSDRREASIQTDSCADLKKNMQDANPYVILATVADLFNDSDYTATWNWSDDQVVKFREELAQLYV